MTFQFRLLGMLSYIIGAIVCTSFSQRSLTNPNNIESLLKGAYNQTIIYDSVNVFTTAFADTKGNVWFATTKKGNFKYDRKPFSNFTTGNGLCGNQLRAILEDRDGMLCFGTEKGLCKMKEGKFENISIPLDDS